jgi:G:T-mismatch repair DNA endonuclease (very short patch repair protein)
MEALDKRQFRYTGLDRKRSHGEPISADIIHPRTKTIILVDGCYFHECPDHGSGKFPEKPAYDREVTRKAEMAGWKVLRFWSHDICDHATISPRLLDVLQRIYEAVS